MALRFFTTMEEGERIGLLVTLEPMRKAEGGQERRPWKKSSGASL